MGKELPLLWNFGHCKLSTFLIFAGEEERRGDCKTCDKMIFDMHETLFIVSSYHLISRADIAIERDEEISKSNLFTLEPLRFLADLSAGLTGCAAAKGGEERRCDSSKCGSEA